MMAIAGGILLGLVAGCSLPFVPFMAVVLVAAAADLAISVATDDSVGSVIFSVVGLLCSSQLGYAMGLAVQTLIQVWTGASRERDRVRSGDDAVSRTDIIAKD